MKKSVNFLIAFYVLSAMAVNVSAQKTNTVRFKETDEVLTNPGIGFMTFGQFNGDNSKSNGDNGRFNFDTSKKVGSSFNGNLENIDYPMTSIAYFRLDWKVIEPEMGKYNWSLIDYILKTAHERRQTLLLRIAPYAGGSERDAPDWYRSMVGGSDLWQNSWRVDANDPRYAEYFCKLITALGKRYDGHPDLEAVDLAIVGFWGEGAGSDMLTQKTRESLVSAYTDNFKKTPLLMLLTDEKTNKYGLSRANVGWRVDCIGDLGFWAEDKDNPSFAHMYDYYPQKIIDCGMRDTWKKAPVSLEICATFKSWKGKRDSCQYCQGYTVDDVNYIIDESLKWHISSFNAKSSGVPEEWKPLIDRWLKRMGYRFVLRSFSYLASVAPNEKLNFKSWWDNKGVAPIYKKFLLAIRLTNGKRSEIMITDADITFWLPGDNLYDDAVFVPHDMPAGIYQLQIGIVDPQSHEPKVNLAIEGRDKEGWYPVGNIEIK